MLLMLFLAIEDDEQLEFMVRLYDKYYAKMKSDALRYVYNSDDAEDVVQAAFISLLNKVELLQTFESYKLSAYIVTTVKNKCTDFNRVRKREKDHFSKEDLDDVLDFISGSANTEDQVMLEFEYEEIGRYLGQIPTVLRDVILMKYIYGYSSRKIAKELGLTSDSVRVYLSRGRKALAEAARREAEKNEIW